MNPLLVAVLKTIGVAAGFALCVYVLYRAVRAVKKRAGRAGIGGEVMSLALMVLSWGGAPDPAREVATETRRLKRNQDGAGDPDLDSDEREP